MRLEVLRVAHEREELGAGDGELRVEQLAVAAQACDPAFQGEHRASAPEHAAGAAHARGGAHVCEDAVLLHQRRHPVLIDVVADRAHRGEVLNDQRLLARVDAVVFESGIPRLRAGGRIINLGDVREVRP